MSWKKCKYFCTFLIRFVLTIRGTITNLFWLNTSPCPMTFPLICCTREPLTVLFIWLVITILFSITHIGEWNALLVVSTFPVSISAGPFLTILFISVVIQTPKWIAFAITHIIHRDTCFPSLAGPHALRTVPTLTNLIVFIWHILTRKGTVTNHVGRDTLSLVGAFPQAFSAVPVLTKGFIWLVWTIRE